MNYGFAILKCCINTAREDGKRYHYTILGLARQQLVYADSVSVLLKRGNVEGATPLLRPMLEIGLGVAHIAQERHEERALAYELARVKRKIRWLRKGDKAHAFGQEVMAGMMNDGLSTAVMDLVPQELTQEADRLEAKLATFPEFAPILAEWDRVKRSSKKYGSKDPEWYALFGGKSQIRELAAQLKSVTLYEFHYKQLSNTVHGGNALDGFLYVGHDIGEYRPLNHPAGFASVLRTAYMVLMTTYEKLVLLYAPEKVGEYHTTIVRGIHPMIDPVIKEAADVFPKWTRWD